MIAARGVTGGGWPPLRFKLLLLHVGEARGKGKKSAAVARWGEGWGKAEKSAAVAPREG